MDTYILLVFHWNSKVKQIMSRSRHRLTLWTLDIVILMWILASKMETEGELASPG